MWSRKIQRIFYIEKFLKHWIIKQIADTLIFNLNMVRMPTSYSDNGVEVITEILHTKEVDTFQ